MYWIKLFKELYSKFKKEGAFYMRMFLLL